MEKDEIKIPCKCCGGKTVLRRNRRAVYYFEEGTWLIDNSTYILHCQEGIYTGCSNNGGYRVLVGVDFVEIQDRATEEILGKVPIL